MNSRNRRATRYKTRFFSLMKHPFFWTLTFIGNSIIFFGAVLLYFFESKAQVHAQFLDFLLWSTGTVTTVGYGDSTPVTFGGKITLFFLMLAGTLFVWSYMGFIVTGLMAPELSSLEKDVHEFEKEIQAFKK